MPPSVSMMKKAAKMTRTTNTPNRVSSEFFINFEIKVRVFKVGVQKTLDERVVEALHFIRCPDGENAAFVDDGNSVGHAKCEVAVVRHHE